MGFFHQNRQEKFIEKMNHELGPGSEILFSKNILLRACSTQLHQYVMKLR